MLKLPSLATSIQSYACSQPSLPLGSRCAGWDLIVIRVSGLCSMRGLVVRHEA